MPLRHASILEMRQLAVVLFGLGLSCATTPGGAADAGDRSACAGDPFGDARMRGVIGTLAQSSWEGRKFDSDGLRQAGRWVRDQFACIGLTPGAPSLPGLPHDAFEQTFETDGDEVEPASDISGYTYEPGKTYTFTNVLGSIPGTGALANEVIVVGAHLDHMGKYGEYNNQMVLGADDDASGILALLSMAKQILAEGAVANRRTIVFAAWGVEEDPFYVRGSKAFFHAIEAADPSGKDRLMYYVNFDMIGGYRYHQNVNAMGTFKGSVGRRLVESIAAAHHEIQIDLGDRGSSSDHATFCENGVPYVFFWTQDDCYHKPCDTPEAIDYEHLGPILRVATDLAKALATDPDLATAKAAWPTAYKAAYPDQSCTRQD